MSVYGHNGAFEGLGKPSIRLEFETNEELVNFQRRMQGNDGGDNPDDGGSFTPGDKALDALSRLATNRPYLKVHTNEADDIDDEEPVTWNAQTEEFEPLEGYGDKYIVTDLRQRAKKEPGEVKNLTKFQFSKFKNAPELFEPVVSVSPTLFSVYPVYKGVNNGIIYFGKEFSDDYNADFILKDYVINKSERLVTLNFARYKAYSTDGVSIVSVWSFSISCPVCNITTAYGSKIDAYFGLIEFAEGLIAVLKNAQSKLRSNSKDYKTLQHQIERWQNAANKYTDTNELGAPGDTYIITDTRERSKKDLDEIKSLQRYKIEPYNADTMFVNENGVIMFPVSELRFDTKSFQNRENEFSEASVNRIIDAVTFDEFNWAIFDPITIWKNPDDGKYYVLSGHSRSEAFRRLAADGATADGRNFEKIPAKIFNGTFEQAKELALNSNTLSTKETDLERANYYRERRNKLQSTGAKVGETKKRLLELARKNEGKNATKIIYLSYLNPRGVVVDAVTATSDGASVDKNRVAVMAEWVGHLRYDFPQLTDAHEVELFEFLKNGHYGVDVKNFNDFAKRVQTAIEKHTEWGNFDAAKSLNLEKNLGKSENEKRYDAELQKLKEAWIVADDTLTRKLAEFKARQKKDSSITDAQIVAAARPYKDAALLAKGAYLAFRDKRGDYLRADEKQLALFGRTAPAALYNNNAIMDFNGMKPTYRQLPDYSQFFATANNATTLAGSGLNDTIQLIADTCRNNYQDCAKIAAHLKGDCKLQSAFNLWHWMRNNIKYEYDTEGKEEVRTPLRTWQDRKRGVDCDCLSVFAWCTLYNMGYNPMFELAAFNGKDNYSHIYLNLDGIIIDRVWYIFNSRPPQITKTAQFGVDMTKELIGKLF
jgi:hypothetical protein